MDNIYLYYYGGVLSFDYMEPYYSVIVNDEKIQISSNIKDSKRVNISYGYGISVTIYIYSARNVIYNKSLIKLLQELRTQIIQYEEDTEEDQMHKIIELIEAVIAFNEFTHNSLDAFTGAINNHPINQLTKSARN